MSEFDYKGQWGIPETSKKMRSSETVEVKKEMERIAREKILDPLKSGTVYTTLARAKNIEDFYSVLEHGLVRPNKVREATNEDGLIFFNRLNEHHKDFLADPIICSKLLRPQDGGFSISVLLNEAKLKAANFFITEAPSTDIGRSNLAGGGSFTGDHDVRPDYFSGIVVGVGTDRTDLNEEVFSEAFREMREFETKEKRKASTGEKAKIFGEVRMRSCKKLQADTEAIARLKESVVRAMAAFFNEHLDPSFALPVYDLEGNTLWPQEQTRS